MTTYDPHNLTPYGIGKFTWNVDAIAHHYALSYSDDQWSSDEGGWTGLLILGAADTDQDARTAEEIGIHLAPNDLAFVNAQQAAIVHEDADGFVYVTWYTSIDKARRDWRNVG